mmetsp:Transcript_4742/g.11696  ORF Transcript_4742/g.11696 Transcript_4742/m.11696 type:complete len:223 (+) Transcript_4742:528-1196(+)
MSFRCSRVFFLLSPAAAPAACNPRWLRIVAASSACCFVSALGGARASAVTTMLTCPRSPIVALRSPCNCARRCISRRYAPSFATRNPSTRMVSDFFAEAAADANVARRFATSASDSVFFSSPLPFALASILLCFLAFFSTRSMRSACIRSFRISFFRFAGLFCDAFFDFEFFDAHSRSSMRSAFEAAASSAASALLSGFLCFSDCSRPPTGNWSAFSAVTPV